MTGVVVKGPRSPRWAFLQKTTVPCQNGEVYLVRRRLLQTPWFGVMLHDIKHPDAGRDPHDHPWAFASLVLRGEYAEVIYGDAGTLTRPYARHWVAGTLHKMPLTSAHRITYASPGLLTLVFTGPRVRTWGFRTPEGFVPWQQYVEDGRAA